MCIRFVIITCVDVCDCTNTLQVVYKFYTLRRLVAKCACFQARDSMTDLDLLPPHQLGFGVSQGAECVVHAARIFVNNLAPHQSLVNVDFRNAFNCMRRDKVMAAVEEFLPSLLPFIHSAYSSLSKLLWEDAEVISAEGVQQGDPIGPLLFCLTIHKMVLQLQSALNIWYLDDGTLGGSQEELLCALETIQQEGAQLGLHLNVHKCELICHNPSSMQSILSSFPDLKIVDPSCATLLGSPLVNATALRSCLETKVHQLKLISDRLCHLDSHDVLILLRHALAILKLLHILRSSPAFCSSVLESYDDILASMVSQITNNTIQTDDPAWLQASLPVGNGGLGIRSAVHLAPSAFLASADAASTVVRQLLSDSIDSSVYPDRDAALFIWKESVTAETEPPLPPSSHRQKSWDLPRVVARWDSLYRNANTPSTTARLLATSMKESGAWLNALPCSTLGLRMTNEAVRIAVGLRLGTPCVSHTFVCIVTVRYHRSAFTASAA